MTIKKSRKQVKRVAMSLPLELDEVLTSLSKLMGQAKVGIITEVLMESLPTFKRMEEILKLQKSGHLEAAEAFLNKFTVEAQSEINSAQTEITRIQKDIKK